MFALRDNVDKIYVLSSETSNIAAFTGLDSLPRSDVTAFLGSLPGILSANRVVVTEGHDKSFDALLNRWLIGDNKIEIHAGGSCTDVLSIVRKSGLWANVSTMLSLTGVIDRDYRDEDYLQSLRHDNIHVLPFHEAESFLCVPEVLCAVSERIASQEIALTPDEVEAAIFEELLKEQNAIAARRVFARSQVNLAVSVTRKILANAQSRDAIVEEIRRSAGIELEKANATIAPERLVEMLDREIEGIGFIISERAVDSALKILPAKSLANRLAQRAGCKNANDLMRSLRRNFKPEDFAVTASFADELRRK